MIQEEKFLELLDEAEKINKPKVLEFEFGRFAILGDIHADFHSLKILTEDLDEPVILLGDYADRGDYPVEVYAELLKGYVEGKFILLRGNHESQPVYPHDLPYKLREYGYGEEVYQKLKEFWENLPHCAILNSEIFAVHGGIYTKGCRIVDEGINLKDLWKKEAREELLWNDPWEKSVCDFNFERGVGYRFGISATRTFLDNLGLKVVVRSHEPYKVLKPEQDGIVVTLGSTGVYGTRIARLRVHGTFKDGYELIKKYGEIF